MLTMTILQDALEDFETQCFIDKEGSVLKGIRFGNKDSIEGLQDNFLYISNQENDVKCTSIYGDITIRNSNIDIIYKCISEYSERLDSWKEDLNNMIFSNCTLHDLSVRSQIFIKSAFFITDESNNVLETSSHKQGSVTEEWDYIIQNKRMMVEVVQDIFKAEQFKRNFYSTGDIPFYYHPQGLNYGGINYRIPSPNKNGYMGTLIIIETKDPFPAGILQYAEIFGRAITHWVKLHYKETPMVSAAIAFENIISGGIPSDSQKVLLSSIIDMKCGLYKVLAVRPVESTIIEHYISLFGEIFSNCVFCNYNNIILILINEINCESLMLSIIKQMKNKILSIGVSNGFENLDQLSGFTHQALFALKFSKDIVSTFNSECAMKFVSDEIKVGRLGECFVYPSLWALKEHDEKHNTDYCHTLYVFLKNERSISASLPDLNIHRNSMIYRLKRISELLDANLEDYYVREHLLLSFRLYEL